MFWYRRPAFDQTGLFTDPKVVFVTKTDTQGARLRLLLLLLLLGTDNWYWSATGMQQTPCCACRLLQAACSQPAPGRARRETRSSQWCGFACRCLLRPLHCVHQLVGQRLARVSGNLPGCTHRSFLPLFRCHSLVQPTASIITFFACRGGT